MASVMTPEELQKLVELTRLKAEHDQRKKSHAAALEAARKQILERGQFVPKAEPPPPIQICF